MSCNSHCAWSISLYMSEKINDGFAGELEYYLHWYYLNYTNFMKLIKYYTVSDFILIL